jgi:hypothetical protein
LNEKINGLQFFLHRSINAVQAYGWLPFEYPSCKVFCISEKNGWQDGQAPFISRTAGIPAMPKTVSPDIEEKINCLSDSYHEAARRTALI